MTGIYHPSPFPKRRNWKYSTVLRYRKTANTVQHGSDMKKQTALIKKTD